MLSIEWFIISINSYRGNENAVLSGSFFTIAGDNSVLSGSAFAGDAALSASVSGTVDILVS